MCESDMLGSEELPKNSENVSPVSDREIRNIVRFEIQLYPDYCNIRIIATILVQNISSLIFSISIWTIGCVLIFEKKAIF